MTKKVSREVAEQEINSWLEAKRISEKSREEKKDQIESLIDSIVEGDLQLQEDNSFVHVLKFPIKGEVEIKQLEYSARIKVATIQAHLQTVKNTDTFGMITAYVAALTEKPKNIIKELDTEDYRIAQAIAIFFL